ncbi:MAG: autotransporter-associated beta strand repeat-containing protein [Verrucomicrobiae bacterium]|nr:autotransporter-associated beta strand repeat-containing protein [Verrucomicrobiae bacterium]
MPLAFGAGGNGSTHGWTNNSANPVTINTNCYFLMGGGGSHTLNLAGAGSFILNNTIQAQNGANLNLTVNGSGTVTLAGTPTPGISYSGTFAATVLNGGTLQLAGANALGTGTLTINGGNLDSSIANLVNLGNNVQTWNGSFGFIGTQNLNIGSGAVAMNANCMVTVNANTFEVDGVITGNGNSLTKAGAGTLFLNNANTYLGGTTISNGVFKLGQAGSIPNVGNVTVYGTLDLNGNSPTIVNLGGSGSVDTVSGGTPTLTISNAISTTFSGMIKNTGGTLALTKLGAGTLTLAGPNTYTGNTTISAGTLLVNGSLGSGAVTVASGATLGGTNSIGGNVAWQSGSSALFSLTPTAAVSGSNATLLAVSGNVTLNGNGVTVNVTGGTPLPPGTYTLMTYNNSGSSGSFATGFPTYTGAGVQPGTASALSTGAGKVTLTVTATGISATWTNSGNGNWSGGANWSSNPSTPHNPGDGATFGVGSSYTTVALDTTVSMGVANFTNASSFRIADSGNVLTLDNKGVGAVVSLTGGSSNAISAVVALNDNLTIAPAAGTSLAITNRITNTGAAKTLAVNGAGTVALSGNNTYGPSAGTVGTILGGGAVLQLGNSSTIGAGDLSVSSSGTVQAGAALTLANNIVAGSGATATLDNNGNNVTLSGIVSGAGGLAKNGAGTLVLNSANTFGNGISINAGTVQLGNASGIPGGAGYGNVNLAASSILDLNGNSTVLNGLNSSSAISTVDSLSGGAVTLTLGESGAGGTYLGTIQNSAGSLALVKDGAGTQTLGGTNNITAGTTINAGTLQVGNGQTNPTGSGMAVGLGGGAVTDNGVLQFNLAGTNVFANDISGSGGVNLNSTGIYNLTGNNTFTGNIINNGAWLWINQATKLGNGPKTIQSVLRPGQIHLDGSAGDLNFDSSFSFVLSGDNGVLINNAGTNTISGNISIIGGAGNPYFVASNGLLNIAGQISTVTGNLARTLTVGGAANGLISGAITEASGVQTSVTKADGGTWDLTGANSYTGSTIVSNGTLIVDGSLSGSSSITVNGGSLLVSASGSRGSGTGTITVNGGTLQLDGSDSATGVTAVNNGSTMLVNGNEYGGGNITVATNGTLGGTGNVYSAITWQVGSMGAFTATASGSTPMTVYGNVVLNGNNLAINVAGGTPLSAGSYTLLSQANIIDSISGAFTNAPVITGAGVAAGTRYFVTTSSSAVTLIVLESTVWTNNGNGNWTTGADWSSNPNYPNAAGQIATLGLGTSFISVNLDSSETIGGVSFTNNNSFAITNAANVLMLNNGGSGTILTVTGGSSNSIATGVSLNENTAVSTALGTALFVPGAISGGGSMTASGNGMLSLSGFNTYSGTTTLNGGTLVLGNTNAIGSGTLTIGGGSLDSSMPNLLNENNNVQNWNGGFTFLGSQNLNLGAGSVTMPNNITLALTNTHQLTVGGAISGAGRLSITNLNASGLATLELDGNNSFSGISFVGPAVLSIGNDNAVGTGTLDILVPGCIIQSSSSATHTITNVLGMQGNSLNITGTGNLVFNGGVPSYNGTKTYNITNPITTFGINLPNGAGGCIKNGPGIFVMTGANVNTGGVTVNQGTVSVGNTNALGTGPLVLNGGGLDSAVANLTNANNNAQTWAGSFYFAGSQNLNLGAGSAVMSTNIAITVSNNTLTVAGAVGGSGALTKAGAGTLDLAGANTWTNNTTVSAGTLEFDHPLLTATNASVSVSNSANLYLNFPATNQVAALILNGVSKNAGIYNSANSGGLISGSGGMLVVPIQTGPTGPAHLTNSVSGSTLSLSWPAGQGWRLEMQTNSLAAGLGTNWFYITDGSINSTNITTDTSKPTVFYRLTYP